MLSPIEEIKNRLDIVEVIGSYIKLQKAGANFRALCPFHSEKKPSLFVSPSRQIWHCFGCGLGYNIFDFVMKIEGVEFGEALRILAKRAGIELKKEDPRLKTERQRLYEICELACQFFEKQLESKTGQLVKKYLLKRGISEKSIKKWRLGYGPDSQRGLSDFLINQGYQPAEIAKAGLLIKDENSLAHYDRFRGRIIFPIFDFNSQVVGFGGRIFGKLEKKEIAKYINTPNTLIYDKSKILYGLDKAKLAILKEKKAILVEGYTDVILSHQGGFENTIATSGTTLTPHQLKILKRYSENLILAFDFDLAGQSATQRGINLAQVRGFNIKIASWPEKEADPAEIIAKNSRDWQKIIEKAKSILEFYFQVAFSKFDKKNPEDKKEIAKILLPPIKRIPNKIEQSHWIQLLSKELQIKEEAIWEELKKCSFSEESLSAEEIKEKQEDILSKSRKERLEERIISLILKSPQNSSLINKEWLKIFSKKNQQILLEILSNKNFEDFQKKLSPKTKDFLNYLFLKTEIENLEQLDIEKEIKYCLSEIKFLKIKDELDQISQEIKKAEEAKDFKRVNDLTKEFNSLIKELK
jgi:DNA primase